MRGLKGKVALVTGGGNGIGEAICKKFSEYGATIVVVDIDEMAGKKVAEEICASGGQASFIYGDISQEPNIIDFTNHAKNKFGQLDILVNCAAAFIMKGIEATVEDWQKIMAVNIMGYALCAKHAVPLMREKGEGAIVNICSISGFIAQPNFVTYNATKGAVANMTRCMALDLAKDNIRVNAVCPGTVWTKSNENFIKQHLGLDRDEADNHPEIGGNHMLKRTANPVEIAEAVAFLASDCASFITAENLMVDGGYTAK